ncbi:MAG: hypothetical protein IPJ88_09115 [Myxococcales bacterium]|nr:MAG: hypothetical protein IPJ88_09115 [Myxococcales bacterium]
MSARFYDVLILGTTPPALASAAFLAKGGFRVLVLGQNTYPYSYRINGIELPRLTSRSYGLSSTLSTHILAKLGLGQELKKNTINRQHALQVCLPNHRFTLGPNRFDNEKEIEREFPEITALASRFFEQCETLSEAFSRLTRTQLSLPPAGLKDSLQLGLRFFQTVNRALVQQGYLLEDFPTQHPFRKSIGAIYQCTAFDRPDNPAPVDLARAFALFTRGQDLAAGELFFEQKLREKILAYGGEIWDDDRASKIILNAKGATEIELANSEKEVGAKTVLVGTSLNEFLELLEDRHPLEPLFERVGQPAAHFARFTVNLLIPRNCIPPSTQGDLLVVSSASSAERNDEILHVQQHPWPEDDKVLLCVGGFLRIDKHRDLSLDTLREDTIGKLEQVFPFIQDHIELIDSPHDGKVPTSPGDKMKVHVDQPWTRGPQTMPTMWEYPTRGLHGLGGLPLRTPLRNLILCNDQVLPGLGMEGALLTAQAATKRVNFIERRRAWLRKGPFFAAVRCKAESSGKKPSKSVAYSVCTKLCTANALLGS